MDHDALAQRLREACASVRTKSYPLADLIPLMQQAADALSVPADVGTANIRFHLCESSLPEATDYSSSYGGQYNSSWCVVLRSNGDAEVRRLTLSDSEKKARDRGERHYSSWEKPGWGRRYVAWAYGGDVAKALDAARAEQATPPSQAPAGLEPPPKGAPGA